MKRTIEIEDTLQGHVDSAISDVKDLLKEWVKDNEGDSKPDLNDLDDSSVHEIIDTCVPIYTYELKCIEFLHGSELDEAYDSSVINETDQDKLTMARVYQYIEAQVNDWWDDHAEEEWLAIRQELRKTKVILDGDSLTGAERNGYKIKIYDEGSGPLWILRNSMGIQGIVRADALEDAYEICEDEIFDEADETIDEIRKECGYTVEIDPENPDSKTFKDDEGHECEEWSFSESAMFHESYGHRNSQNSTDTHKHGIYAKDLNGESLDKLTPKFIEELGITLEISNPE